MIKQLAITALLLIPVLSFAQETKSKRQDQFVLDLNYDTFLNKPSDVKFKWYGHGVNIQFFYDKPLLKSNQLSLAIGAGFSTQNYYTNAQVRQDPSRTEDYSAWTKVPDSISYKRNKISSNWIEIPLEFRYRSKEDSKGYSWKFALGGKVGYLIDTHDKIRHSNGDKYKTYIFPNNNEWRYGVLTRIGYGKINLTAFYSLSPWFKEGKGREMNQLSIGISVVPF